MKQSQAPPARSICIITSSPSNAPPPETSSRRSRSEMNLRPRMIYKLMQISADDNSWEIRLVSLAYLLHFLGGGFVLFSTHKKSPIEGLFGWGLYLHASPQQHAG